MPSFSPSADWGRDRGCPARGFGRPVRGRRAPNAGCGKPRGRGQSPRAGFRGSRRPAVRPRVSRPTRHRGGPHAGYGAWSFHFSMLPVGHAYVAGWPRLSADRLNSVTRARTECNTGGSPNSGGRRNDVEERRAGAGSAKDSELEEPDACGVGGDLEAGPCRLDQGEAGQIALADHAEKTMRFEIGSGQLTDLAGRPKERAADIPSLPLHPVGLGRVENVVAIADLHARIRVAFQQVRARRLQIPQIGVESDMSVFMGECRAQAVLPVLIPGQGSRDPHTRFPAGLEMREPLDIAAIAGQVCELVERLGAPARSPQRRQTLWPTCDAYLERLFQPIARPRSTSRVTIRCSAPARSRNRAEPWRGR